jgi:hypothetical protein
LRNYAKPKPKIIMPPLENQTAIDETANWQIYTDEIYNYSIKYPSFWTTSVGNPGQKIGPNGDKIYFIQASAFMNECMVSVSTSSISVSNTTFTKRYYLGVSEGEMCQGTALSNFNEIWVISPQGEYGFVYQYPKTLEGSANQFVDQILSTFKFVDLAESATQRVDCSVMAEGTGITYLSSYFQGDQCVFHTRLNCEAADVVVLKGNRLDESTGQDGINDCIWFEESDPLNRCKPKYYCGS